MKSVILDTNVFVSGIFWSGPPFIILNAWKNQQLKLVISLDILDEYIRVGNILANKYKNVDLSRFMDLLTVQADVATPSILNEQVSMDPDDDKFIACAIGARCNTIVSGDKDLLTVTGYEVIEILKPANFVKKYL